MKLFLLLLALWLLLTQSLAAGEVLLGAACALGGTLMTSKATAT